MSAERQNVVLVYPISLDGKRVLMQFHKNAEDPSYNRYNGISAQPDRNESLVEAAQRALRKAGIQEAELEFRGGVHWSRFDAHDYPLFGHHFLAHVTEDTAVVLEDDHVRRRWIAPEELMSGSLPCWPGDSHIFPLLFDSNPIPFHGLMIYDQGLPQEWRYARA